MTDPVATAFTDAWTDCMRDHDATMATGPCDLCCDKHAARLRAATVPSMPLDDDTARELSRAAKQAVTWTERRNMLIREAVAGGAGVREVARAVGLTHPAVLNIIKPRKRT